MVICGVLPRQITASRPVPAKLTPLVQYSCRLSVAPKKVNSFRIKQIQTLLQNTRGMGYLARLLRLCTTITHRFFTPLFSWSYELLFLQPLSFHNHLRCPLVFWFRPSLFTSCLPTTHLPSLPTPYTLLQTLCRCEKS